MAAAVIDLNAIRQPQTPITCVFVGQLSGLFAQHDTFENSVSSALSDAGVPAASLVVDWAGPFSAEFRATIIARTTAQIVTAWQVAYRCGQVIEQVNGTKPTITVTKVGTPGEVITPPDPTGSALDKALGGTGDFLGKFFGDIGAVLKWGIIALLILAVLFVVIIYGAPAAARARAATA